MMSLLISLGVILILAILYMIFRVSNLITIAKGPKRDEKGGTANKVNAALFIVFMVLSLGGFFWYSFAYFDDYNLPIASEHGAWTDTLFWITMAVSVAAFVIISIIMFVFIYQYQYREGQKAKYYPDNHYLELAWTIIPAIVLAILIFTGLRAWNDITDAASKDAELVELIGQQFAWTARYPGTKDGILGHNNYKLIDDINEFGLDLTDKNSFDDFKSLELHLPVNKEILLRIRAKDVLHSVFLPHFRVKMDAVPGMPTQFKFTATKTTQQMREELGNPNFNYELACAEICGRGHFSMKMSVVVEDEESYEKWKASQEAWLKQNPDYLKKVPEALKEAAMIKAGMVKDPGSSVAETND
ncbi:MAG TPA: cytochrome c oxidase subunit II [Chryseolinea sp.]|jgi:cytochrome c oxidase subunit II|nr:cytochrome c oxidase subunit II [Chryseolinea sp.]